MSCCGALRAGWPCYCWPSGAPGPVLLGSPAMADSGSSSQHRAAEEFLAAVGSGDAQAIAHAVHPEHLDLLRKRLLDEMRLEADRRENIIRGRLFGVGMPLADLERLTSLDFFACACQHAATRRAQVRTCRMAGGSSRQRRDGAAGGTWPAAEGPGHGARAGAGVTGALGQGLEGRGAAGAAGQARRPGVGSRAGAGRRPDCSH